MMHRAVPLTLFWFFYFGGLGIFFPYFSLYLRENAGLTGTEVGFVIAMIPLVGIFAQPFWGQVADRTGARRLVLTVVTFGAGVGFVSLAFAHGFPAFVYATMGLALFSTAVVPMSVSVTLAAMRAEGPHAYGLVRVWGTLGFLLFVVGFPWMLNHLQGTWALTTPPGGPSEPALQLMFIVTTGLVFIAALIALGLPHTGAVALRALRGDWRVLFRVGPAVRLFLFVFVAYLFLNGPMWFFPVLIRSHGGTMDTVGRMWVLMLLVEIPLVALSGAAIQRVGIRGLLAFGVLAGGLRWIVCGITADLQILYTVQLLHGVVVVGVLVGAPLYLDAVAPERLRSTGQGVLAMAGIGLGCIISNTSAGWLLEHVGSHAPYLVGGIGALTLGCLVPWILPAPETLVRNDPSDVTARESSGTYPASPG